MKTSSDSRTSTRPYIRHGLCKTPEYIAWKNMKARCNNSNLAAFRNYGGRGIRICERWNDFLPFLADMGRRPSPQHSINRIDNDGNYEPDNCEWATDLEQTNNQRTNRNLTLNGRTQTVTQWAREVGLPESALRMRLDADWAVERALTEPLNVQAEPLTDLAKDAQLPISTVRNRLKRGWSIEQSLRTPRQKSGQFRYSDQEIEAIRKYRSDGHTLKETAERFGCANSHVSRLVNGKQRRHTTP